jgi:soluble lytic murein transglycosylase-like protein
MGMVIAIACLLSIAAWGQTTPDFQESVRQAMAASLEAQRTSVQKQVSAVVPSDGFYTVPWPKPIALNTGPDCDPLPKPELDRLVGEAGQREGVDNNLIQLVIGKESAAKPCALSPKGAKGLMQLMPSTADLLGVADPFDPKQNIDGGVKLLKQLLTKYNGDAALALGAYNAGAGRVDREGGVPQIPETMNYVSDILSRFGVQ